MAIPANELAKIQADLAAMCLDKDCEIQRDSTSKGSYGQELDNYTHLSYCKASMAQPGAGLLQNYDYAIRDLATWKVALPAGQDVKRGDHLLIEGNTLEVHVLLEPHTVSGLTNVLAAELK